MLLVDDYKLESKLGSGSFADVYYTSKKGTNEIYATKRVDKTKALSDKMKNYFLNEVDILKKTNHQNIIKLHEIKNSQKNFYLIMEFCNGGTLQDMFEKHYELYMKPLPEAQVQHILRQISCGIYYLHKSSIIHRDLKMENILFHYESKEDKEKMNVLKSQCKIIDFGFAKYLNDKTATSSICGSPISMDPEILKALVYKQIDQNFSYTDKADIWSLGIMVYTMLIGKPPFIANNYEDLYMKINEGNYHIPKTLKLSKQAISLINGMLMYDNTERLSIDQLIFHEFLTKDVKDFEYCNLNYIDKGKGEITLNNKEDSKKIWDNYQVMNNKNMNLSEIRGNLGEKSIINDINQNNLYDANKNFQAFYIDDNNNIVFTNGVPDKQQSSQKNLNSNYNANTKSDLSVTEINVNSNLKNERNTCPNIDALTINPNSTNYNLKENFSRKNSIQDQINERLRKYEDRGKEFKRITEMLYEELETKQNKKNKLVQFSENNELKSPANIYENQSPIAGAEQNSNSNLSSAHGYSKQNSIFNPSFPSHNLTMPSSALNNTLESKKSSNNSNILIQNEKKKSEYKSNHDTQFDYVGYETAPVANPIATEKRGASKFFTNATDLMQQTIKVNSGLSKLEKYREAKTNRETEYYITEPNNVGLKNTLANEINLMESINLEEKIRGISDIKTQTATSSKYFDSIYVGDIRPNAVKTNDAIIPTNINNNNMNSYENNLYSSIQVFNTPGNNYFQKLYGTNQKQNNFNLNSSINSNLSSKNIIEVNAKSRDNFQQPENKNVLNNPNPSDLISSKNVNFYQDLSKAYEIITSGRTDKYIQVPSSKPLILNEMTQLNSSLNVNKEASNFITRCSKEFAFSSTDANAFLKKDKDNFHLILIENNIKTAKTDVVKFPLNQKSLNIVLDMKKSIEKSVDSFNNEINNCNYPQYNQSPLQENLKKIFEDIKIKMNEAMSLIEKEEK